MRLLYALVVLAVVLAEASSTRHHLRHFDDDYNDGREMLRSILQQRQINRLGLNDGEEDDIGDLFYSNKRASIEAKKCTSVKQGTYYSGDTTRFIHIIDTYQDCMNQCEKDANCYGWAYQASSKTCTVQNSIGWATSDASYVGGSCIGLAAKEKVCKEILPNTIYNGENGQYFSVPTVEACMQKCDITPTCLGYMFNSDYNACQTQTAQYGSGSVTGWTGGSCVVPKPAYPPLSIDEYRQQAEDQHNAYRSKHCAPPLHLNATLNNIAQSYAESLAAANKFEHSGNTLNGQWLGENLFMSGGGKPLFSEGSVSVTAWYNEIKDYAWANPGFSSATGHFTQVIWVGSTQLGIGRAVAKDETTMYVVANYFPGGNVAGGYVDNVKPASC